MGLMILFRKTGNTNPFREALHNLIQLRGEKLIITSGYISEGTFSLLENRNMLPFLNVAENNGLKEIILAAGKFSRYPEWIERYRNFVRRLDHSVGPKINVKPYLFQNWHAKVSLKILNRTPIAAIIGSSNLTSTAYGLNRNNFNRECDVVIWNNNFVTNEFREVTDKMKDEESFIYFDRPDINEPVRLNNLYKEIVGKIESEGELIG